MEYITDFYDMGFSIYPNFAKLFLVLQYTQNKFNKQISTTAAKKMFGSNMFNMIESINKNAEHKIVKMNDLSSFELDPDVYHSKVFYEGNYTESNKPKIAAFLKSFDKIIEEDVKTPTIKGAIIDIIKRNPGMTRQEIISRFEDELREGEFKVKSPQKERSHNIASAISTLLDEGNIKVPQEINKRSQIAPIFDKDHEIKRSEYRTVEDDILDKVISEKGIFYNQVFTDVKGYNYYLLKDGIENLLSSGKLITNGEPLEKPETCVYPVGFDPQEMYKGINAMVLDLVKDRPGITRIELVDFISKNNPKKSSVYSSQVIDRLVRNDIIIPNIDKSLRGAKFFVQDGTKEYYTVRDYIVDTLRSNENHILTKKSLQDGAREHFNYHISPSSFITILKSLIKKDLIIADDSRLLKDTRIKLSLPIKEKS